ncbi:hypothetical protein [Sphingomonas phyllosphaerae]|uniref:hypothetical protein n=1 Tax=Sphingomonas phyllosphaerae TaxID=257003 RepID=UPI0012DD1766|nr:hypothetical protein [Sphingomonas phyllosphaerae]
MLEVLNGHHERMHLCLEFHRELCSEKLPQTGRIALSRLRITAAAAERSRFLAKEILPILQGSSFPDIERLIDQLTADLHGRQAEAKAHIDRWNLEAIERDWPGYQTASRRAMTSIERRITIEAYILKPILQHLEQ